MAYMHHAYAHAHGLTEGYGGERNAEGGFEERRRSSGGPSGGAGGGQRDQPWAHRVYMGNLPFDIEAEDIAAFFRDKVRRLLRLCCLIICVLVGGSRACTHIHW
jgi:hypothetical protein